MKKPSAGCLKNAGCVVALAFLLDFVGGIVGFNGPVTRAYVGTYNAVQWARATIPTPARIWRRHKAAGPPPDPRVVAAGNDFGVRVFRRLCDATPRENVFCSPYSANAALCLVYNGADGQTRAAMESAMSLNGIPTADVNKAQSRMAELLDYTDPRVQASAANSVWADRRAELNPDFIRTAEEWYQGHAEALDFSAIGTPARINAWVRNHTGGRIDGAVGRLPDKTGVVLANAIYFHGEWSVKFKKNNTRPGEFRLIDGTVKEVPMMYRGGVTQYFGGPGFQGARMPYGDGGLAMYVCVPDRESNLPALLERVTGANLDAWMKNVHEGDGGISMPRIHVESALSLNEPLKQLGMGRAFEPVGEFTLMGSPLLYLGDILQKAYLDVDEEGTTAAAMTMPKMWLASEHSPLRVDRPFFLAIRDDRSGAILFAGAIYDPQPR